ncbi:hypothetical protein [Flagellimonas marinaquae]|uniref:hypothetical protein n=1 Tax=Flagellimonas marinaquae TaxID=254955 RepID=UPI000F8E3AFF|nr:hypothetical protein [Allomuricauda aquimarina]
MKKLILPTLVLLLMGCDKEDAIPNNAPDTTSDAAINALTEYVLVNKIFQDVGNSNGDAILGAENNTAGSAGKTTLNMTSQVEITVSPADFVNFPKTITVDFKDGMLGQDGVLRKGVVTVVSTNWYGQPESTHTATFQDYYHNDYKVEGTHIVENLGANEDGHLEYSVEINDGKITTKVGDVIQYQEDSKRTWISGSETPLNIWDDEYLLDGLQTGISSAGLDYSLSTIEPLHFVLVPRGIKSGVLSVDLGDIKDIELNYTNSTITILGTTYPFTK